MRREKDVACAQGFTKMIKGKMAKLSGSLIDHLKDHWQEHHGMDHDLAKAQALTIYMAALTLHVEELFQAFRLETEIYSRELYMDFSEGIIHAPSAGLERALADMADAADRMDAELERILTSKTSH